MRRTSLAILLLVSTLLFHATMPAFSSDKKDQAKTDKKAEKPAPLLIVPPTGGKEVQLADWRFAQGTRHLALSADAPKGKAGPEHLEFREEKSTTYKNGIYTYIPLASLRKLEYDRDKKTVTAVAVQHGDTDATLVGSTKFTSNKITLEGDAILEGLGAATVKFQGGNDKGIQRVTFPQPKPADKVKGPVAVVTADDKEKTKHTVHDVQPVFLVDGQYRTMLYVMFKKTVKVDFDKLAGLRWAPSDEKKKVANEYEVTLKDGVKHTLSILMVVELEKKKTMSFVGLVGRVPVGYKLFMLDAIAEYRAVADDGKK
ncbi:MAG: hypothetical protein HYR84_10380 [Planctomycetes bacterium]|nr:hypothetical protein [Planctomycetota bacterium]